MKLYQPDITEIEQIQDSFQKHIQEAIENYDEFLKKCLEQCEITQDYVLEHPEEFSKRENTQGDFCQYFRNGEEIFTIACHKEYEDMSHCIIKCVATFPNHTK